MKFVPNVMWGDCGRKESMGVGQGGGGGETSVFVSKTSISLLISVDDNGLVDLHPFQQYFSHIRSDGRVIT